MLFPETTADDPRHELASRNAHHLEGGMGASERAGTT